MMGLCFSFSPSHCHVHSPYNSQASQASQHRCSWKGFKFHAQPQSSAYYCLKKYRLYKKSDKMPNMTPLIVQFSLLEIYSVNYKGVHWPLYSSRDWLICCASTTFDGNRDIKTTCVSNLFWRSARVYITFHVNLPSQISEKSCLHCVVLRQYLFAPFKKCIL